MYSSTSSKLDSMALLESKTTKQSKRSTLIIAILGILLGMSLLTVFGLAISYGVLSSDRDDVCMSEECVGLSSQISSYMDMSVDPCEDFYSFTCKGFKEESIIPFGMESVSTLSQTASVNVERIRTLMESNNNRSLYSLQKAIEYYQSCMDIQAIELQSVSKLQEVLLSLGGWPLVGVGFNSTWSINDEDSYLTEQLYGSTAFLYLSVSPYANDSSRNVLYVSQGGLTVPSQSFYFSNSSRFQFIATVMMVLQTINSTMPLETYQQAAQEILDLETKIAAITDFEYLTSLPQDSSNITTTYSALEDMLPEFNWIDNMNFYGRLGDFSISASDPVGLYAPPLYLLGLNDLIRDTEPRILQNYAKWHLVFNLLKDLSEPFGNIYQDVQTAFNEKFVKLPHYQHCVSRVTDRFKYAVARTFTDKYVSPTIMENLSTLLSNVKQALGQRIQERNWLDDSTKMRALNKLKLIESFTAYPKNILNDAFLDSFYSTINISDSNGHLINELSVRRFSSISALSYIGKTNLRENWYLNLMPPTILNAAYYPLLNQIYVFEGILETPVYESHWPNYFKYGTLGFVIGHEYTHGFDNNGQHFDETGKLVDWWSELSQMEFNSRTDCFVKQYSNYSVDAGPVDGNLTLSENIADNGGLAAAYLAYQNTVKYTGQEKSLPGLPYTPEQLFFIGASQVWCQVATLKGQADLLMNVHSPSSIRPLGVMSNSRDFARAFKCPSGSRMNPKEKCELW